MQNSLGIDVEYYKRISLKYCKSILDEISHYTPRDKPVEPSELIDYRASSQQKKRELFAAGFFSQAHIQEYLDLKWKNEIYNRDCFYRLYELYETCDHNEKGAVYEKLLQFDRFVFKDDIFPALRLNRSKFKFSSTKEIAWDD
jgi:hypothetical protein